MAKRTAIFHIALLIVLSWQLVAAVVANAQCEYRSEQFLEQLSTLDSLRHRTGKHSAFARAKFQCVCDHTCRSRCTPSFDSKRCTERGRPQGGRHPRSPCQGEVDVRHQGKRG